MYWYADPTWCLIWEVWWTTNNNLSLRIVIYVKANIKHYSLKVWYIIIVNSDIYFTWKVKKIKFKVNEIIKNTIVIQNAQNFSWNLTVSTTSYGLCWKVHFKNGHSGNLSWADHKNKKIMYRAEWRFRHDRQAVLELWRMLPPAPFLSAYLKVAIYQRKQSFTFLEDQALENNINIFFC